MELLSDIQQSLTHWGRVTHICGSKLAIIGSDNGLAPGRRRAIIWTKCWNIVECNLVEWYKQLILLIDH